MTSSDKVNEITPKQQEQKSDSQKSKITSPNAGMMGANAVLAAAKIDEDYSYQEENIIKKALIKLGASNEELNDILSEGKIVFHDFFHRNTGVQKAVEEILGPPKHKVGSIGVYE